jgi:NAD+ diphosphatase
MLPSSQLTFAGNPLDRASERRGDRAWIAEAWDNPSALVVALWNGQPLVEDAPGENRAVQIAYVQAELARLAAPEPDRQLFLGLWKDTPVFAVDFDGAADPTAGPLKDLGRFEDLRAVAARLPAPDAGVIATAKGMFEWSRRHRHCSVCGQAVAVAEAGWKRACPACAAEHFPRTDPVVIMLATHGEQCLLGRQSRFPKGMYSALAGFLEPGETIEEACARELKEEAGLTATAVTYYAAQPWPYPSSLMIGLFAEVSDTDAAPDQTELEEVRWFTREAARRLIAGDVPDAFAPPPLAIGHHLIKAWAEGAG